VLTDLDTLVVNLEQKVNQEILELQVNLESRELKVLMAQVQILDNLELMEI